VDARELKQEGADEVIVAALASGTTEVEAGRRAGVSDRTVRRRLEDPAFVDRVRQVRSETMQRAAGQSAAHVSDAIEVLHDLLRSESDTVKLRAAQLVIDVARRLVTESDVLIGLERLERLERQSDEDRGTP